MPMVLFCNLDPLISIFARYLGPFMHKTHFVHRPIFVRNLGISQFNTTMHRGYLTQTQLEHWLDAPMPDRREHGYSPVLSISTGWTKGPPRRISSALLTSGGTNRHSVLPTPVTLPPRFPSSGKGSGLP